MIRAIFRARDLLCSSPQWMVVVGLKSEYSRSLISYLWWGLGLGYPLGIGCGTPLVRGLVGGLEGGITINTKKQNQTMQNQQNVNDLVKQWYDYE